MRTASVAAVLSAAVLMGAGCRREFIHNVTGAPVTSPRPLTMQDMSEVITGGAERAG